MPSKKKSSSSKSKSTTSRNPTPVKEAVAPIPETTSEEVPSLLLADEFSELIAETQSVQQRLSALRAKLRNLQKQHVRAVKAAEKRGRKNRAGKAQRKPSGFVKPARISKALADFLGRAPGTEMARTEVTKEINAYIREKQLQDPRNGRIIIADTALSGLLNLNGDDELTYFNLQRYMSPHFEKSAKSTKSS